MSLDRFISRVPSLDIEHSKIAVDDSFVKDVTFLGFHLIFVYLQAKHLQLVSGLDRVTYWVANYCWDFVNFLIVFVILLACFAVFQVAALSGPNLGTVAVILVSKLTVKIDFISFYRANH